MESVIVPIIKNKKKRINDKGNYRPKCLPNVCSQIVVMALTRHLNDSLNNSIHNQFGFKLDHVYLLLKNYCVFILHTDQLCISPFICLYSIRSPLYKFLTKLENGGVAKWVKQGAFLMSWPIWIISAHILMHTISTVVQVTLLWTISYMLTIFLTNDAYFGHIICDDLSDESDMKAKARQMYARSNRKRFHLCSSDVKNKLFTTLFLTIGPIRPIHVSSMGEMY